MLLLTETDRVFFAVLSEWIVAPHPPASMPPPVPKGSLDRHRRAAPSIPREPSSPASPRADIDSAISAALGGTGRSWHRLRFACHSVPSPVASVHESSSFARYARCRPSCTDVLA